MTLGEDDKIPADVMEAASAWLLRFEEDLEEDGAPDAEEHDRLKAELDTWLAADEAHRRAWELAQRAWSLAGEAPAETEAVNTPATEEGRGEANALPPLKTPLRARRSAASQAPAAWMRQAARPKFAIPAAAAALLLFLLAPTLSLWMRSDFQTATAETHSLSLDDGSQVVMGAESAVARDFSGNRREVALLHGEAWFEVSHEETRPFIVTAGDMTITVTGTAFDVAMTDRTVAIALARGSVEVEWPRETPLKKTLEPGQRLAIDRKDGAVLITDVDPALMGGWRNGRLIVHGARLADVVDRIDRYHPGTITLIGRSVTERRVTGVFDLANPEKALRSLVSPYGVSVRKLTPWHTIVSDE